MEKEQLWRLFTQTGRVEDYLRYREAVMSAAQARKETTDGTDSKGTDRPRTQYR